VAVAGTGASVRPGEWYAVLSPSTAVLLPPGERGRAAAAWRALDARRAGGTSATGAAPAAHPVGEAAGTVAALLDAVLVDGLAGLASLVVLHRTGDAVHVLLRGAPVVRATSVGPEGPVARELRGDAALTWAEHELRGVERLEVILDPGAAGIGSSGAADLWADVPDGPVLLRTGGLLLGPAGPAAPAAAADAPAAPVAEPAPASTPDDEVTEALPLAGGGPSPWPPWPPAGAAQPPAPAAPAGAPAPPAPPVVARLRLPDGRLVDVDRPVLLGRAPLAARAAPHPAGPPHLVVVESPHLEVSSTHLEVRPGSGPDEGAALALDAGSTNGTLLVPPGGRPTDLRPGEPVRVGPGTALDLGDGVVVRVLAP